MTHRAKVWSVAVSTAITLLAGAIFGFSARLIVPALLWAGSQSVSIAGSWLHERYKRTRKRPFQILGFGSVPAAAGVTLLFALSIRWFDASVGEIFGGVLAGSAWAVAALINLRSFIKGPGAPPPLRWRDLIAPRPQS